MNEYLVHYSTLCIGDLNITNLVVEVKSELEKIREQIQNIE